MTRRRTQKKAGSEAAATAPKPKAVSMKKQTALLIEAGKRVTSPANENSAGSEERRILMDCPKRGGELVRVQIATFKRSTFLDVRTWVPEGTGHKATRQGATIPLERLWELREALAKLDLPEPPESAQQAA